jgi:CubicO group peptidase (beta-lactamase class C family)
MSKKMPSGFELLGRAALAAIVLLGTSSCGQEAAPVPPADPWSRVASARTSQAVLALDVDQQARHRAFADVLAAQLQARGVPGGALGIVQEGRLVFATGLGVKRAGSPDPVGPDTVFRVASTTKPLTAAMVMTLVQEGKVSLDAPITRYLPDLRLLPPFDPRRLTLRQLLSHTAGVPDYTEVDCAEGPGALAGWFAAHPNLVLWSPPGRLWSYSNLGFSLAGLAAEQAAGLPYRDLVERRVLQPFGMRTATFDVNEVMDRADYAEAHAGAGAPDITLGRCALLEPPGYMYASVRDLGKLSEGLLRGGAPVLKPWSLLQMAVPHASIQAPPDFFYGLGLLGFPFRGRLLIGHDGDLPGMHSAWLLVPEARFGVIVLVNSDGFPPIIGAIQAVNTFVELDDTPPPDWSTPPSDWGRYVGHYDGTPPEGGFPPYGLGRFDVELEGDQLFLTTPDDGARYQLMQQARDTFALYVGATPVGVTFWRDRTGQAEYVATRAGAARRAPPPAAPPAPPPASLRAAKVESPFARIAREHPQDSTLEILRALRQPAP